jgi:hypothetical protein
MLTAQVRTGGSGDICSGEQSSRRRIPNLHAFLGALIFLALFVSCFLVWKAIEWLRDRRKGDGVAAEGEQKPYAPEGFGREGFGAAVTDSHLTDMAGFSAREEEEFLLHHGPKQVRKAIKERRKAREKRKNTRTSHRL